MSTTPRIAVIGAGSWGTALAVLLARHGHAVRIWGHDPAHIANLSDTGLNQAFLPDIAFPDNLHATADLAWALDAADEVLVVVPSHAFTQVIDAVYRLQPKQRTLSWATKGFEPDRGRLLHEVARDFFPDAALAVLSGPTCAREVALGLPTAITVASTETTHAAQLAEGGEFLGE